MANKPLPYADCLLVQTQPCPQPVFEGAVPLAIAQATSLSITVPQEAQALLFTSRHGAAAAPVGLPAYVVGEATAQAAQKAGHTVVLVGNGDGASMAAAITAQQMPPQYFYHVHGPHVRTQWYAALKQAGHTVQGQQGYTLQWIEKLSPTDVETLQSVKNVLLFSRRAAEHLICLLTQANINPQRYTAVVLSPRIAAATQMFGQTWVANAPTMAAMHNKVDEVKTHDQSQKITSRSA